MEDKKKIQVPRIVLIIGIVLMVVIIVGIIWAIVAGNSSQEEKPILENEQTQNKEIDITKENTIVEEIADEPVQQIAINTIAEVN